MPKMRSSWKIPMIFYQTNATFLVAGVTKITLSFDYNRTFLVRSQMR